MSAIPLILDVSFLMTKISDLWLQKAGLMAKEIERKFFVYGDFKASATGSVDIIQTYMMTSPAKTIRIRIAGDSAYLTVKTRSELASITRDEWNIPLEMQVAEELMAVCLPGRVVKTRYFVPAGKHTWEIDVFHEHNEGLVIAEIELEYEDEAFEKPEWLGPEVTGDPRYCSSNLAR
jgi:CYTH domain-containing protein